VRGCCGIWAWSPGRTAPSITNIKLFAIPFLALTVEPEPLPWLFRHPAATSVQEDAALAPL
jgi:hypothetical protein